MAPMALFASWLRPTDRLMLKWTDKITYWSLLYTQHCLRRVMKLRRPKSESFLFKDTKVACAQLLNLPHQQASHLMIYSFSYRSKSSSVNGGPKVGGCPTHHTWLDRFNYLIWSHTGKETAAWYLVYKVSSCRRDRPNIIETAQSLRCQI